MTVQELLLANDFRAMLPHIVAFDPSQAVAGAYYREAYDILTAMKPAMGERQVLVAENREGHPFVSHLEGAIWREAMGWEIDRAEGLQCSDVELGAQCLWHLTFYGFTPQQVQETAASFGKERQSRRARIAGLMDDLTSVSPQLDGKKLKYLYRTEPFSVETFTSHTRLQSQRMDYLADLLTHYSHPAFDNTTHLLLLLTTSVHHPSSKKEAAALAALAENISSPRQQRIIATGTEKGLGKAARIRVIASDEKVRK